MGQDRNFNYLFLNEEKVTEALLNRDDTYGMYAKTFTLKEEKEAHKYHKNNKGSFIYKLFDYAESQVERSPHNGTGIPILNAKKTYIGYLVSTPQRAQQERKERNVYRMY